MGRREKSRRTFVLKVNHHCNCDGCADKVREVVEKIKGVDSMKIKKEEQGMKATISGDVNPHTVVEELGKKNKIAELLGEEEESPPHVKKQEMQIVVPQISARNQRKVAPLSQDVIVEPIDKPRAKEIHDCHPKHDHELELRSYNKPFQCDGCKEEGFGSRYRCEPCDYNLHQECMHPKTIITHEFLQGSTLVFRHEPAERICDACGWEIHGYSYHCEANGLDLHPRCSNLKGKLGIGGTEFVLHKKAKNNCFCCKKKLAKNNIQGWCYVSKCNKFNCHVYCVSQMVHEAWRRGDLYRKDDDDDDDGTSMALEKVDLKRIVAKSSTRDGGGGRAFLKTISLIIRAIVGILVGDPTVVMLSMLVELIPR